MKRTLVLAISIIFILSGCNKKDEIDLIHLIDNLKFTESPIDLQGIEAKFARNIQYDSKASTRFDIFLPNSNAPTALVFYIHGGSFLYGDKDAIYNPDVHFIKEIRTLIKNCIAFATIQYSFLDGDKETEGIKKPMGDIKRALQFVRYHSEILNIDKDKIALTGSSAGAGTSLWIGFNDDMKDETSDDEVLRESTRVTAIAVVNTQSTYDVQQWEDDILIDFGFKLSYFDPIFIKSIYAISNINELNSPNTLAYRKEVDMLALLSSDDPEFFASNAKIAVKPSADLSLWSAEHHPYHVRALKQRADSVGVKNVCYYGNGPNAYKDLSNESLIGFVLRKL
ncbi:MAG: carboxylesterase family protein, partial [Flavobacteriales bacterium]|nr:carboxylesterase family protein [Flavobacteriales bacterium]